MRRLLALIPLLAIAFACMRSEAQISSFHSSPEAIRAQAREILRAPEYQWKPERAGPLERIGNWLSDKIKSLFEAMSERLRFTGGGGASYVLLWVVLIATAGLLVFLIVRAIDLFAARSRSASAKTFSARLAFEDSAEEEMCDPDALLVRARDLAGRGDLRRAYRCAFLALLNGLDRAGYLRFERQRTNGEYERALRSKPEVYSAMLPAFRAFDRRWYGETEISSEDLSDLLGRFERIPTASSPA